MSVDYDEEEFGDFLSKVDNINSLVQGLKDGTVDPNDLEIVKEEEKVKKQTAEKEAKRAAQKAEQEKKIAEAKAEHARKEAFREENKEKLEELKQNYYLRKARRERWMEFREQNKSRAFSDYYKGWDLFEEDPDEELFSDSNSPAAVQDQSAFDAMAKDIEQRTKERKGQQAAAEKEREAGNLAFRACQYTEAVAAYSRAIEHFKGDKTATANRAAAHLKLRNFLSALDDCSRVLDIAKFLDEDHDRRPVPPPVLKAYVRRATANLELGRFDDAAADLTTALEMAPEAEVGEIKRQQKALREETAAAKAEARALEAHAAAGGAGADGGQASRERVRELLDVVRSASAEAVAELGTVLDMANHLEAAEQQGGGKKASEARAAAANAALKRGRSEERATKALDELSRLAGDSTAARVVLRQAGGVSTLLALLDSKKPVAPPANSAAAAPSPTGGEENSPPPPAAAATAGATSEAATAARALWSVAVGRLLCVACSERRNQLEVHQCGGTSQLLRELRRSVPLDAASAAAATPTPPADAPKKADKSGGGTKGGGASHASQAAQAARAATYAALAPQMRLLTVCCEHETVAADVRRLAAGEGTVERLLVLLGETGPPDAAGGGKKGDKKGDKAGDKAGGLPPSQELLTAAMGLLGSLCNGPGAKSKQALLPHVAPICAVLARHVLSAHVPLAEKAATAFGLLSAHPKFRKEMVGNASKGGLSALLQLLPAKFGNDGAAEECLLPNALAALHNCSLHPDAMGLIASEETAAALIPRLKAHPGLARRAAAVLAKCAVRVPRVVELLLTGGAIPGLVAAVVSEGASHDAAEDAPRVVDVTDEPEAGGGDAGAEAEAEEAAATEEEMVGSAVRILTACAGKPEAAKLICEGGALPALVKLLQRGDTTLQGNAALCLAKCAEEERSLAVLAVQPVVAPLLAIAHNQKGQACKNAAIALGRLAKNPRCLQQIRDQHGIEILARAMKGQLNF